MSWTDTEEDVIDSDMYLDDVNDVMFINFCRSYEWEWHVSDQMRERLKCLLKYVTTRQFPYHSQVQWDCKFEFDDFELNELMGEFIKTASVCTIDEKYRTYGPLLGIESVSASTVLCNTCDCSMLSRELFPNVEMVSFGSDSERYDNSHQDPMVDFIRQITTVYQFPLTVYFVANDLLVSRHQIRFMLFFIKNATMLNRVDMRIMRETPVFECFPMDTMTLTTTDDLHTSLSLANAPDIKQQIELTMEFVDSFKFGQWDDEPKLVHKFVGILLKEWNVSVTVCKQTRIHSKLRPCNVLQ